jgi:nucleotide-binding universal stress UspA family protein
MVTSKCFNRILLATDGSDQARAAVDATLAFAHGSFAQVRVVHVWNLEVHHRHGYWDVEARSEARRLVDATVNRLQASGLVADCEICRADSGHVAAAIAAEARNFMADLVIVGSRGLSEWQSMVKHSVSQKLVTVLDCPVLIVRERRVGSQGRHVLLAIAGGSDIAPGVRAAVAAASAPGSEVLVVHVARASVAAQGFACVEPEEDIQLTMADAIRLLNDAGFVAQSMVARPGPVAEVVAEIAESWRADLILIGSNGLGDVASPLLGSVSNDLVLASQRAVPIGER